nr:immunoglobulin heavy chain junction region [Homo sapiens]MOL85532.1 immunoglobulin heavy chain junction region [Homo sapiens]MOL85619.1 immunoglobulin heavy chain junction region [Homo sapiens]MOL85698.1 immunoglobulin heavy chain junction region [Homo sapiens]MOM56713.1 immunoglobulin heavy chain junction region [Homo sapiens]
CARLQAGDW